MSPHKVAKAVEMDVIKIIGSALFLTLCLQGCGWSNNPSTPQHSALAAVNISTTEQQKPTKNVLSDEKDDDSVAIYPEGDFNTSVVQILADRSRYHGKKVQIKGYLHIQFEDSAIYMSKECAEYGMTRNAFWVEVDKKTIPFEGVVGPKQFDKKFVLIEGVFNKSSHGHGGLFQGCIDKVYRISELHKHPD